MSTGRAQIIGLTGGIASGKSYVAAALRARGAIVIDADKLARDVVEPGQPALAKIVEAFGPDMLRADGTLNRAKLGAIVFSDPNARQTLEAITHPAIALRAQEIADAASRRGARVVFYEAALLVENGAHKNLDALIVVSASREAQRERVAKRDGLEGSDIDARLSAQLPLADKLAVATWVVPNDGDVTQLDAAVVDLVAKLEDRYGPIAAPRSVTPARVTTGDRMLITGFPAMTARRMIAHVLASEPATRMMVLARKKFSDHAAAFLATLPPEHAARAEVLEGDVCDLDLGLSSMEYASLRRTMTSIMHLAGVYFTGVDNQTARLMNVAGTRGVLELAADAPNMSRMLHWSTAQVAGKRRGEVREEELPHHAGFHNQYEKTKHEAETLVRAAMARVPITVVRPSIIVGDSRTGEIDRLDGPYYLMALIATNPSGVRLPLPGQGLAPLNLVPIDYTIEAAHALFRDERAVGRTVHLVDPQPLAARDVFRMVAEHAHTVLPRPFAPGALTRLLLRAPGLAGLARSPLAFLDAFDQHVSFKTRGARELLVPRGIVCPPLQSYLGKLVAHVISRRGTTGSPR